MSASGRGRRDRDVRWWRRWWDSVRWYVREVSGEAEYERYLCGFEGLHSCGTPVSRKEFERRRSASRESSATTRCC